MPSNFKSDFAWSQLWIPQMQSIIGAFLTRESTIEEDTKEATDLVVMNGGGMRIACRIRKPGYSRQYGGDITITCRRESGAPCEWHKMILGEWGDWFFYGHATSIDPGNGIIKPWWLIDLIKARIVLREGHWLEFPNRDPTGKRCWFHPINVELYLADAVIAGMLDEPWQRAPLKPKAPSVAWIPTKPDPQLLLL